MKKILVTLCTLALLVSIASCKKEKDPVVENPIPVYKEGVYHPIMKVVTVSENGDTTQEWSWVGDNLDHITWADGEVTNYSYNGNLITRVASNQDLGEELRYTYAGEQMTKCEVYYEGNLAVTMDLQHNAAGKISGGIISIDDNFLMTLAGQLLGQGSFFEKLLGTRTAEAMVQMARIAKAQPDSKFSIDNKNFTMNFEWNGENVDKQILNGSFVLNVTSEDLELVQNFIEIPEQVLQVIQMVMAMTGGNLPLQVSLTDTIVATYDSMYNPMFCNWGTLLSPLTLSRANVLTQENHFVAALAISMMGQTQELLRQPEDTFEEYRYEYNDKHYPTKKIGDTEIIYTYKN